MTPEQIQLVQNSWQQVVPIASQATEMFYQRLFQIAPHTRSLFGGDIKEQGKKLATLLTTVVKGLNKLDSLELAVWQLGRRHTAYGVSNDLYQPVAEALLWTLKEGLGAQFTPQVEAAWVAAYTLLATVMQAGGDYDYANFSKWKAEQSA